MSLRHYSVLSLVGFRLLRPSKSTDMSGVDLDNNTRTRCNVNNVKSAPELGESLTFEDPEDHTRFSSGWVRWCPTSPGQLQEAEEKLLGSLKHTYEGRYVPINSEDKLWTISLNPSQSNKTPIVLIHGFGSGVGLWSHNLDALSTRRPLHAFDMLGFGRSSRPKLPFDAELAEQEFVNAIEAWRQNMGIEKMILVGHSFGGYLTYAYGIRHPSRVSHLVLADPWGFPKKPDESDPENQLPLWARAIRAMISPFNPLSTIRAAGPLGPRLVRKFRSDMKRRFESIIDDDTVCNYIYHLNAQTPSGEIAFKSMSTSFAWAVNPMIMRATAVPAHVPITVMYGSKSWMDIDMGNELKYRRQGQGSEVNVHILKGAGHHVYADKAGMFNALIYDLCDKVD
ncbi:(Lyso)-N-acylphosphatidylethanolamine lipase-like [Amphiura filiformis]|uniref:(Lyso)-N-acylphosphatidylethanolamine lipase-like n=1 Tax=Amphiura filiformis TaxID=82378 RepID=UPI003B218410